MLVAGTLWKVRQAGSGPGGNADSAESGGGGGEITESFRSLRRSFSVGLSCKVESHQTVESAPYGQGHGGAVQQPVGVAALQVDGNAVRCLREQKQR